MGIPINKFIKQLNLRQSGLVIFKLLISSFILFLHGCALDGAPAVSLVGAYFPSWMFSVLIAVVVAILARTIFVSTGIANWLPYQFLVCSSVGIIFGLLSWLFFFGV